MKRLVVPPLLGMVLTGCALGRSPMPEPEPSHAPVGHRPVPSLRETINAGIAPAPVPSSPPPAADPAPILEPPPAATPPSPAPVVDPEVRPASMRKEPRDAAVRSEVDSGQLVGSTIATVGGVPIGLRDLEDAVREWRRTNVPKGQTITREDLNQLAESLLEQLIDRQLYVQEAKRILLKTDKQKQLFEEFATKQWKEREIPRLVRKYRAKNEIDLRQKLAESGRSIELMRQNYLTDTLAREFLHQKLKGRLNEPAPQELYAYYQAHLDEFDRSAQVTWREVAVKIPPGADRAASWSRARELHERLRRGEDFATVAKSASQGPTADKGGLWQTEPGASAVPAVNTALESLPLNQLSTILEGPNSLHIVRVEARRPAGPQPWEDGEVQHTIREKLNEQAFRAAMEAYTKDLRQRTVITYTYAGDAPKAAGRRTRDPGARRVSAPAGP
jgi:parvulin-like peptidyl-prolyl isomerase